MIKILTGFFPWILYFFLIGVTRLEIAIIAALISTCILGFRELKKGFFLTWGTIVYFLFLLALSLFDPTNRLLIHSDLLANGALLFIAAVSLAINKPFTLQYARAEVDKKKQKSPIFFRINQILTGVWGICFGIATTGSILHICSIISNLTYQIIACTPFVFAIWFTVRFPNWYKNL